LERLEETMSIRAIQRTAIAALMAAVAGVAQAAPAGPVGDLPGRWSGWGAVVYGNGESERVKCVATYFIEANGDAVRQNLRCASRGYDIDATASLRVSDGRVSGAWEEKRWAATGSVAGRVTDDGFNLSIKGDTFSAAMAVSTSGCKRSINITPQGFDITRISIGLGRC
jgi:hypothetical protein